MRGACNIETWLMEAQLSFNHNHSLVDSCDFPPKCYGICSVNSQSIQESDISFAMVAFPCEDRENNMMVYKVEEKEKKETKHCF